ncbi:MAG: aspartate aminotransferase family protein, partial [Deltaproteobacteria bacterium]|nr:aspartate aminotransferase family protein [Deltaproteobacteria bacterium]
MSNYDNYWSPFNSSNANNSIEIVRGSGVYLYDNMNNQYLDAYSGLWNMHYGYDDEDIKSAIKKQLDILPYINPITLNTPIVGELSRVLCKITDKGISKIVYTCSGSESVEAAIKISRKYHSLKGSKRNKIAVLEHSYHGNYYGSMSASAYEESFKDGYGPMLEGFVKLSIPFCRCCKTENISDNCKSIMLDTLEKEINIYKDDLCAIMIEPVVASGGIIPLFKEYIQKIDELCKNNDILLICDEVATGFGRTGNMFCFQKYNISPDLITLSKGINNGYLPLGAVCVAEKIDNEFSSKNEILFHLSTQNGNPICVAAALANIKKMEDNNVLETISNIGDVIEKTLNKEIGSFKTVFEIRRAGLMFAIDLIDVYSGLP